jgi:hypothetical protein
LMPCSWPIFNQANWQIHQVSTKHYLFWIELHILAQQGDLIVALLDKTGGLTHWGNISTLPEEGSRLQTWISPCGSGVTQQPCGESQALHCLGETRSELKQSL